MRKFAETLGSHKATEGFLVLEVSLLICYTIIMRWIPLHDNQPYSFTYEDLPSLVHGEKGSGASLFTLTLLSELYRQGEPLILLSEGEAAKTEFLDQANDSPDIISLTDQAQIQTAQEHQVIHVTKEHELLLPHLLENLPDKMERVVLIKNMETFSSDTIALFYRHPLVMFSGDLNKSLDKESLLQLKFNAKFFFSPLHNDLRLSLPPLEKYHGYFLGRISQGTVSLKQAA